MVIADLQFNIPNEIFKELEYEQEPFNNPNDVAVWLTQGYGPKFTGDMCDMRKAQPLWTVDIIEYFQNKLGWKNIGTSFYRMNTGTVLPVHSDLYKKYIQLHGLYNREHDIHRAIVFLEDWSSGHYLELDNVPVVEWKAGQCVIWQYNTPHMAANIGLRPRYTLQITGHV